MINMLIDGLDIENKVRTRKLLNYFKVSIAIIERHLKQFNKHLTLLSDQFKMIFFNLFGVSRQTSFICMWKTLLPMST